MIRELITNVVVSIEFVRSQQNLADHLTNGLARELVIKSAKGMGLKAQRPIVQNNFESHISLSIHAYDDVELMGDLRADNKSSLDSAALLILYLTITQFEDFLVHDVNMLVASSEKYINSDRLKHGINQLLSIVEPCHQPWVDGLVLLEDREKIKHYLPTCCESFDMLLQGGFREGHVTELLGPSSSGKTQVSIKPMA
ncbi:DNA repair protein RAD51 homolog 4 isoform X1 [Tanacetum coccineum]